MKAVRVVDAGVLDAPMVAVGGSLTPAGGIQGSGDVFLIDHDGDNALATLRYRFARADFRAAEEPFDAAGTHFDRGSFVVRGVSRADFEAATKELGLKSYAVSTAPDVAMHPLRAARAAILHTWTSTQTEGWWRMAFDKLDLPYTYISVQDVAKEPNLNGKYDVIIFPPAGGSGQSIIEGMPMWRNPMPWQHTAETPNIGRIDETADVRPGLGWSGLANLQRFVERGGVLITSTNTSNFAVDYGLTSGVSTNDPSSRVVGSLLRSRIVDQKSPIVYGIPDSLAIYSDDGASFSISSTRGGRGFRGLRPGSGGRPTGRGRADEPDVPQGRPLLDPKFEAPPAPEVEPWQPAPVTDEMMRDPLNVIPPDQRPRVVLRFGDSRGLLVSGLLGGGGNDIAQRPVVVDVPVQKGHVVMFANNPVWRGGTIGSYFLVFNTLLNWDSLNTGRTLDER